MKILKSHAFSLVVVCSLFFSSACVRFNHEPTDIELGSYHISVRPQCDDRSTTANRRIEEDGSSRITDYELKCGDTTVVIRDSQLTVNGKSYGTLTDGDRIAIDFGKVRVNFEVREEVP